MDMKGEQRIPADIHAVWKALNDPDILRASIPGCQELIKHSDTEMTAIAVVKVGPISARFQGKVTLSDLDPPNGYRITGEGQGGVAGHAKGGATVQLLADGSETILRYEASAQVGGRLAQLGGRMIDATARSMSAAFFSKFADVVQNGLTGAATKPKGAVATAAPLQGQRVALGPEPRAQNLPAWLWVLCGFLGGLLLAALSGFIRFGNAVSDRATPDTVVPVTVLLAVLLGFVLGRQQRSSAGAVP